MKNILLTLFFIPLISLSQTVKAEELSPVMKEFFKGFYPSCFKSQRENPVNKGLDDNLLKSYCTCSGYYVARRVDPNVLVRFKDRIIEVYGQTIKDSGPYCIQHINEY